MNFFLAIIHSTETFTQFNIFSNYDIQPFYNLLLLFGICACVCMQVNQREYLQITWNTFLSSEPMPASNFLSLKVVYYAAFEFFKAEKLPPGKKIQDDCDLALCFHFQVL